MKKKIMFIEDEADVRDAVKYILEAEDFEFFGAVGGAEGIGQLLKNKVDLLLLDISMPGMDGFEVCRAIKNEPSINLPVIFISARTTATDMARGFALGADDYIVKPFEPAELVQCVKRVLDKYDRRQNQGGQA